MATGRKPAGKGTIPGTLIVLAFIIFLAGIALVFMSFYLIGWSA